MLLEFSVSCLVVYYSYDSVHNMMSGLDAYEESPRQLYIQKNIVKGLYLMILSSIATIYFCLFPWTNYMLKLLAACYVSNDIVGLYRCELPTSTKIHHLTSGIFLILTYSLDFTASHIGRLLVWYTYCSSLAFTVNLYLGLRLCYEIHPRWLVQLHTFSKWWYLLLCIFNWLSQMYLMSSLDIQTGMYSMMIILIVMDDVILLKWLFKDDAWY